TKPDTRPSTSFSNSVSKASVTQDESRHRARSAGYGTTGDRVVGLDYMLCERDANISPTKRGYSRVTSHRRIHSTCWLAWSLSPGRARVSRLGSRTGSPRWRKPRLIHWIQRGAQPLSLKSRSCGPLAG